MAVMAVNITLTAVKYMEILKIQMNSAAEQAQEITVVPGEVLSV